MRMPWLCLSTCILLQHTSALPNLSIRDADVDTVPHPGRPQQKPIPLSSHTAHSDITRPENKDINVQDKHMNIVALVQSYLITMNDLGMRTWLMHDTLLSWYQGRRMRPFRSRVDVMISKKSIEYMAEFCNMTVYWHKPQGSKHSRAYLLEVRRHWNESEVDSVDARWTDTYTGLFIDLVTSRESPTHQDAGEKKKKYRGKPYALLETVFEGVPVRVPAAYADMLAEEYGEKAPSPSDLD